MGGSGGRAARQARYLACRPAPSPSPPTARRTSLWPGSPATGWWSRRARRAPGSRSASAARTRPSRPPSRCPRSPDPPRPPRSPSPAPAVPATGPSPPGHLPARRTRPGCRNRALVTLVPLVPRPVSAASPEMTRNPRLMSPCQPGSPGSRSSAGSQVNVMQSLCNEMLLIADNFLLTFPVRMELAFVHGTRPGPWLRRAGLPRQWRPA